MVESINRIGQLPGLHTIAEWVEDGQALDRLQTLQVDFAKHYYIHRPEPLAAWGSRTCIPT
jgi:EAL domain-containing protein (putative c-di-GMP-specific phosphodiesterase class I)